MKKNYRNTIESSIIIGSWLLIICILGNFIFNSFISVSANELAEYEYTELHSYIEELSNSNNFYSDRESTNFTTDSEPTSSTTIFKQPPSKINLLRTKTNTIEEIDIETYLEGVVAAEMPTDFELEALKAQAVVCRGFIFSTTLNTSKHSKNSGADLCDSHECCQAYNPSKVNETIKQAVRETRGLTPMFEGDYAETLYFASTLGGTLTNAQVWGNENKFTSIYKELEGPSPESKILPNTKNEYPYSTYSVSLSINSFINLVNSKYPKANLTNENIKDNVKILSRTKGDFVEKLKLGDVTISGTDARYKLLNKLKSANFSINFEGTNIVFTSRGNGHGAGMSQWGANALAKEGNNFNEIIDYYFKNLTIEQLY